MLSLPFQQTRPRIQKRRGLEGRVECGQSARLAQTSLGDLVGNGVYNHFRSSAYTQLLQFHAGHASWRAEQAGRTINKLTAFIIPTIHASDFTTRRGFVLKSRLLRMASNDVRENLRQTACFGLLNSISMSHCAQQTVRQ